MLKVSSYLPTGLCVYAGDTEQCARICRWLVVEGCSFYFEPWPNNRARIFVDQEHAPRVGVLLGPGGSYGGPKQRNLMREASGVGFCPEFYPGQQIRVYFNNPRWAA